MFCRRKCDWKYYKPGVTHHVQRPVLFIENKGADCIYRFPLPPETLESEVRVVEERSIGYNYSITSLVIIYKVGNEDKSMSEARQPVMFSSDYSYKVCIKDRILFIECHNQKLQQPQPIPITKCK